MYKNAIASRILSFLYSRTEALKLAFDQDYDCVLTTRFDIGQRGGSEVNQIRFNTKDATRDNLFTPHWNQMNAGYGDMWFYGSQGIMEKYSTIYKEALEDFKPNSEYEKILTSGWPDSKEFNVYDTEDIRQFSNEVEKPDSHRSKNLMKFPRWRMSDSHLYHKWFCMKTGLYPKTIWVK